MLEGHVPERDWEFDSPRRHYLAHLRKLAKRLDSRSGDSLSSTLRVGISFQESEADRRAAPAWKAV